MARFLIYYYGSDDVEDDAGQRSSILTDVVVLSAIRLVAKFYPKTIRITEKLCLKTPGQLNDSDTA